MKIRILLLTVLFMFTTAFADGDGLKIAVKNTGICFGNSKNFNGLRINTVDRNVERIRGINVTLWPVGSNEMSGDVTGASIGVMPMAARMSGLNFGLLGLGSEENLNGISLGLFGAGAGGNINGLAFGGLGAGSGGDINGLAFGLAGMGAGGSLRGLGLGGFGMGVGEDLTGVGLGGFGMGVGRDMKGFSMSLFGSGFGRNMTGISVTGIGMGAGESMNGLMFSGIGMGAGTRIQGIAVSGLGMGAGESIRGLAFAGLGMGSKNLQGIMLSFGRIMVLDGGEFMGIGASAYNRIDGQQTGVLFGLVNRTKTLTGVQIGLINIVEENPKPFRVLPFINASL